MARLPLPLRLGSVTYCTNVFVRSSISMENWACFIIQLQIILSQQICAYAERWGESLMATVCNTYGLKFVSDPQTKIIAIAFRFLDYAFLPLLSGLEVTIEGNYVQTMCNSSSIRQLKLEVPLHFGRCWWPRGYVWLCSPHCARLVEMLNDDCHRLSRE